MWRFLIVENNPKPLNYVPFGSVLVFQDLEIEIQRSKNGDWKFEIGSLEEERKKCRVSSDR
jgi:hypothetical protein